MSTTIISPAFELLSFLLPGIVSGWVFYSLSARPKPSAFERTVQALFFTVIVQMIAGPTGLVLGPKGIFSAVGWHTALLSAVSFGVAALLGIIAAHIANRDLFGLLRKLGITTETSAPSRLYTTFSDHEYYVVLHLAGDRRLMGFPKEWSCNPDSGHFLLDDPKWVTDDRKLIPIKTVTRIMVPASGVRMLEFCSPQAGRESKP